MPTTPTTNYLSNDILGSPRVITDLLGAVVSRRDFMPFGEEISNLFGGRTSALGYLEDNISQKFTSKERDTETGLDSFGARYFSSKLGRFMSSDYINDTTDFSRPRPLIYSSISTPQTLNLFTYANNNPFKFVDIDGHNPRKPVPGANGYCDGQEKQEEKLSLLF